MPYLSLYRKYRSQAFDEVSGQDHVTRTLQNAIRGGRVAHAYLFCGPRGTGKTSTARLLSKALNCENGPTPEPCNTCEACTQIGQGRYLDMNEIDAASNRGIDEIRNLRDNVAYAPASGRYKVYVVDEAHQITGDAFNALLKTLEEPPPHVVFVMATTEAHKIPATIVSRCQKFEFRRASLDQLRDRVRYVAEQEGAEIEPVAVDLIAREANGGWRDALSLLEQVLAYSDGKITAKHVYSVLGTVEAETLHALADRILEANGAEVFRLLDELIAEGKDPRQLLRDLTAHFRTLMLTGAGSPPPGEPTEAARIAAQAKRYGQMRLIAAIEVLAQAEREARWSEQPRLLVEVAAARLMHPRESVSAAATAAAPAAEAPRAAPPASRPAPAPSQPAPSQPARTTPARSTPPAPTPPTPPAPPSVSAASPFVDEEPAPAPNRSAPSAGGFGGGELPPPPLTVGDARTGGRDEDDDFDFFPPAPAPQPAAPVSPASGPSTTSPPAPSAPVQAEPGPPAATVTRPGTAPASGDIDTLKRKWRLVGEELKRDRKVHIQTYLADTEPDRFEGDVLVLRFPNRTMAEGFEKRGKEFAEPVAEAVQRVTGIACKIRPEVAGAAGAPGATGARRGAASRPTTPEPAKGSAAPASAPPKPVSAPARAAPVSPDPSTRPPGPPPAGAGGENLVHNVLDIFDGQVLEEHE